MAKAKCLRCKASAESDTYEQARQLINHVIGLSRGIKCGDSYNCVVEEIKPKETIAKNIPKLETTKSFTSSSEKPKEKTKQTKSSTSNSVK